MITMQGMPSVYTESEDTARAWERGRDVADRAHNHSEAYGEPFTAEATDTPSTYAGRPMVIAAFRDGYAVRAQDIIDGTIEG